MILKNIYTILPSVQENKLIQYLRNNSDLLANHLLVLIAFFLPISAKTTGFFYALLLILFLFKKEKFNAIKKIKDNAVAWSVIAYVMLYYFGILFADDINSAYHYAKKAAFLLNIILIIIFLQYKFIPRILTAYVLGVFVSELFSYSLAFGLLDGPFFGSHPFASFENPSPFMFHIHYGFTLAFTAYLLLEIFKRHVSFLYRLLTGLFLLSISINLVLNVGRTGYVLYIIGIVLFIFFYYKKQSLKILPFALILISSIYFLAYQYSPIFKSRIDQTTSSIVDIYTHNAYNSSIGLRLEKYSQSVDLFVKEPFFGYGTGQHLEVAYQDAKEKKLWYANIIKDQPTLDSEYLDILIQFGLFGLLIYLNIFYQAIKYQQNDTYLKNIQLVLIIFYILFSFEAVGIIHHTLSRTFLFFMAITLVKKQPDETALEKISYKTLSYYILMGTLFFLSSQIHLGDSIKTIYAQY